MTNGEEIVQREQSRRDREKMEVSELEMNCIELDR
jgi:hypothetical protein